MQTVHYSMRVKVPIGRHESGSELADETRI